MPVAQALELRGSLTQGSLLRGKVPEGSKVWLNDEPVKTLSSGEFVIGFGRDAGPQQALRWQTPDGEMHSKPLTLAERQYPTQHIEGVPQAMVTPPERVLARIKDDNWRVAVARKTDSLRTDFNSEFVWPAEGPITGVYGSQRVFNGVPKRPHYGVDVGAPTGTAVTAPAGGKVTLAHPDLYYSGGTIIIDHGLGVNSTFLHLSKLSVAVGDIVKQGDKIGEIGATGRATGPHLDWRINWFNERLDPALLVPPR
ncbi:M23 family metallopeptidase [Alteromonas gilva]|uniref:M23 family metallopeptidase n=1 Tax=Alteromonas gilva TaxID=2987522 RepID=A0ABT5L1T1_9ALTE|nr:M23 family metallopeptidase [Alteromonas gilva]MDC8830980.1 M23 family metallopeptidase [Alteromonas gilva]